jgi:hypothetical protein
MVLLHKNRTSIIQNFQRVVTNAGQDVSAYKAIVIAPEGSAVMVSPETLIFSKMNEKKSYNLTIKYEGE